MARKRRRYYVRRCKPGQQLTLTLKLSARERGFIRIIGPKELLIHLDNEHDKKA